MKAKPEDTGDVGLPALRLSQFLLVYLGEQTYRNRHPAIATGIKKSAAIAKPTFWQRSR